VPYKSKKQEGYIRAQAARGVKWAKKFVADSEGKAKKRAKTKPKR
jgi:hypothetical protein